jgi:putative membrane protein
MSKDISVVSGVVAGVAGGLAAAWLVQEFLTIQEGTRLQTEPRVNYAFGAVAGGVYGGLAEYSPAVRSGFGATFGGMLFSVADRMEIPALNACPKTAPIASHVLFGVTAELVRRVVRRLL